MPPALLYCGSIALRARTSGTRDERNVSMDFASVFFSHLIEFAKSPDFGGEHASLAVPQEGVLGIYKVRWQNDQGLPRWEMLVPVFLPAGSDGAFPNPEFFGSLLHASGDAAYAPEPRPLAERRGALKKAGRMCGGSFGGAMYAAAAPE